MFPVYKALPVINLMFLSFSRSCFRDKDLFCSFSSLNDVAHPFDMELIAVLLTPNFLALSAILMQSEAHKAHAFIVLFMVDLLSMCSDVLLC